MSYCAKLSDICREDLPTFHQLSAYFEKIVQVKNTNERGLVLSKEILIFLDVEIRNLSEPLLVLLAFHFYLVWLSLNLLFVRPNYC